MRLIIDISEYNAEYIKNAYGIPQDINTVIAESIINGKQVPTPHGRLGDLDALWDRMYKYIDNEGAKMPFGDNDFMIHKDSACELIEDAPTVIEAED